MTTESAPDPAQDRLRERVLDAATELLARAGRDALTTRSVAAAAGVQPPVLYRLFGDKAGLLDAVAVRGYATYLRGKREEAADHSDADPLDELRCGWDQHVGFGLAHPAVYRLMVGERAGEPSPADLAGRAHLARKIAALARSGRLRVSEERAALLFHAACSGLVLTLLSLPEGERDLSLSVLAREGALASITADAAPATADGLSGAAITLGARLSGDAPDAPLSPGELLLLRELLQRLAAAT